MLTPPAAEAFEPSLYTEQELFYDLPYYLKHFPALANAVVQDGPDLGFIDLPVHRTPHAPYNLRVVENHVAFAYLYTTNRPWNPWYGDARVRTRLEATLKFIEQRQQSDGSLSEYSPETSNAAATSFGARALVRTLEMLEGGRAIDPAAMDAGKRAARNAINALFEDKWFNVGQSFANQVESVWYAAPTYADLYGDEEMARKVETRLPQSQQFQSPAGFFYENNGVDWNYNLRTHVRFVHMAIYETRDFAPEVVKEIQQRERRFFEWLSYNALPEPGGEQFVLNGGIQTRGQGFTSFADLGELPAAEDIPLARAFALTSERVAQAAEARRLALTRAGTDAVDPLDRYAFPIFELTTPFVLPTNAQRQEAIRQLPALRDEPFVHRRLDRHLDDRLMSFTYVRRDGYYAAFNTGPRIRPHQRFGMGLIWTPTLGTVLQNPTAETNDTSLMSSRPSWGAAREAFTQPLNPDPQQVEWWVDGQPFTSEEAVTDLPDGEFELRYAFKDEGHASWRFLANRIVGEIVLPGDFYFHLPLLVSSEDVVTLEPGRLILTEADGGLNVSWNGSTEALLRSTGSNVLDKQRLFVAIPATDRLQLEILLPEPTSVAVFGVLGSLALLRRR